jgi:dihydroorotate dehydrogenase
MNEKSRMKKKLLLEEINNMIKAFEDLPVHAKISPVTQYDYCLILIMLRLILTCEDEDE